MSLWLCALLLATTAHAQRMNFQRVDASHGLPQNIVYDLEQDEEGYLWIATGEGLARYDGANIEVYKKEHGLEEDFATCLLLDSKQQLWAGHYDGGLSVKRDGSWKTVKPTGSGDPLKSLLEFGPDTLLFLTQREGLFSHDANGLHTLLAAGDQPSGTYEALESCPNRNIYIGMSNGLVSARMQQGHLSNPQQVKAFDGLSITAMLFHRESQTMLVGTRNAGVLQWDMNTESQTSPVRWENGQSIKGRIQTFSELSDGQVGVGTTKGLYVLEQDISESWKLVDYYGEEQGLEDLHINALLGDREGNTWIGTFGGGLNLLPWNRLAIYNEIGDLKSKTINCILQEDQHRYHLGTEQGVVTLQFDRLPDHSVPWTGYTVIERPSKVPINTILQVNDQTFWAGSDGLGLFAFSADDPELRPLVLDAVPQQAVITHLGRAKHGKVWISTLSHGAYEYDLVSQKSTRFSVENGLLHNDIYYTFHDAEDYTWFVTRGTGLAKMRKDELIYYSNEQGFETLDFNCITQAKNEAIWIGTAGSGIYQLDSNKLSTFSTEQGLPSNFIYSIAPLNDHLWVISQQHVTLLYPTSGAKVNLHSLQGDSRFGFRQNALEEGPAGTMLLGSNKGLFRAQIPFGNLRGSLPIQAYLRSVQVSGNERDVQEALHLPYDKYRLRFGFEHVLLNRLGNLQFQYYLEGYESDWNAPTNEQEVDYTGLPDGTYTLHLRCGTPTSLADAPTANYTFTIATPFWKTWWFLLTGIAVALASVFGVIRWREYNLRRTNRQLESMVDERTEEIQRQNREIEEFTYAISHDLKTPVFNINGLLEMLRSSEQNINEERSEIYTLIQETSGHLRENLERLMEVIKAKEAGKEEKTKVSLEELLVELEKNIYIMINQNHALINTDLAVTDLWFNRSNLYSIIYNLVTNAIKYRSPERFPVVQISTKKEDGFIRLDISDNGLGMDLDKDGEKLFGMFKRIHDHVEGSGVGLHLIKKMIENSGGRITVQSVPGDGSTFSVYLPENP